MYDRSYEDRELNFEPSGALEKASLVLRDRETDSWWSIMSSRGIGGALEGAELKELPVSEKLPWGEWKKKHPDTLVLSVGGVEHDETNVYTNYFGSDRTFRGVEVDDDRLSPKAPIYSFWYHDRPQAIASQDIEGGALVRLDDESWGLFFREPSASVFASSRAYRLTQEQVGKTRSAKELLTKIDSGDLDPAGDLGGFDTYWYNWVIVNPQTELLTRKP